MPARPDTTTGRPADASPPSATPAELLFADLEHELGATRRVLKRAPSDHADWRPHEKSMTLAQLATHVAELPAFPTMMLAEDASEVSPSATRPGEVADADERLAIFDERAAELRERIGALTWERARGEWSLHMGGEVVLQGPRAVMVRSAGLSHMAHHRAQLGVYLRMLDVPVPGVYGPSADESWGEAPDR